jgi:hypothetical protein
MTAFVRFLIGCRVIRTPFDSESQWLFGVRDSVNCARFIVSFVLTLNYGSMLNPEPEWHRPQVVILVGSLPPKAREPL